VTPTERMWFVIGFALGFALTLFVFHLASKTRQLVLAHWRDKREAGPLMG